MNLELFQDLITLYLLLIILSIQFFPFTVLKMREEVEVNLFREFATQVEPLVNLPISLQADSKNDGT